MTTVHGIAEYDRIGSRKFIRLVFSRLQIYAISNFDHVIAVSDSIKQNLIKKGVEGKK